MSFISTLIKIRKKNGRICSTVRKLAAYLHVRTVHPRQFPHFHTRLCIPAEHRQCKQRMPTN